VSPTRLRALIVDDERLARRELRHMLAEFDWIEVAGEADSVDAAVELIRREEPDVVFLDIQMPERSGFELLERVDATFKVIFATAFDAHAIRAFEVNALDYLLKPISPDRLARAVGRLRGEAPRPETAHRKLEASDRIYLVADDRPHLVKIETIACIRAAGDYSEVTTLDGRRLFVQKALKEWEERLPENVFARVHRSTIVNVERIERIDETVARAYVVHLAGLPEPIAMSRRYAGELKARFS
jgi:two-component system LytT family response regulator